MNKWLNMTTSKIPNGVSPFLVHMESQILSIFNAYIKLVGSLL